MKKSENLSPVLKNVDTLIGSKDTALNFFDQNPLELIKYAKSKGMLIIKDVSEIESLPGSHYNIAPKGFREITQEEFASGYFRYILKPQCSKQIHSDADGNRISSITTIRLWEVDYKGWEGMGYAMAYEYGKNKMRYFKFGEEKRWQKNESAFGAQFAGDNS